MVFAAPAQTKKEKELEKERREKEEAEREDQRRREEVRKAEAEKKRKLEVCSACTHEWIDVKTVAERKWTPNMCRLHTVAKW